MCLLPHYIHIVNPKLKHIYLSFNGQGELVIKSPKVSLSQIEKILLKKSSWIEKSRQKLTEKKGKTLNFSQACVLYFLGKAYPLYLHKSDKKRTKLIFDGQCFTLFYSTYNEEHFQKKIDTFYKTEALQYISPLVVDLSKMMKLRPTGITFRKTKRQWGSCSAQNRLSFNTMLMKASSEVITYVIIHELAHIKHKHHQKSFWSLVEAYLPEYKNYINELKHYST